MNRHRPSDATTMAAAALPVAEALAMNRRPRLTAAVATRKRPMLKSAPGRLVPMDRGTRRRTVEQPLPGHPLPGPPSLGTEAVSRPAGRPPPVTLSGVKGSA